MIIKNKYFLLEKEKFFQNGEKKIIINEKILYLCTNKDSMRFLIVKDDCMIVFCTKKNEVKFLEEIEEEISEKDKKIIDSIIKEEFITI